MDDTGDVRTAMSGPAFVHYSQIHVHALDDVEAFADLPACFRGQRNGLCGAAASGVLFLITGLHTGNVGFAVEVHPSEPPLGDEWEEVVEASFRPRAAVSLTEWGGGRSWPLDLPEVDHRVRYCAVGMDEGNTQDNRVDGEPPVDRYLLQFWPAPPEPDRVLRETGRLAAYWHKAVGEYPPPPTPGEVAGTERAHEAEARRVEDELRARDEAAMWGGRPPGERLRALSGNASGVARLDRDLLDAITAVDPATQRRIARWVARRTIAEAGLAGVDWIAGALTAIDRGSPVSPAFDDPVWWERLFTDERVPRTVVTSLSGDVENVSQQAMAFPALLSAGDEDPLRAAVDALWCGAATFGYGRPSVLFAGVRRAFPEVGVGHGLGSGGVG